MPELIPVLSESEIAQSIESIARKISSDYQNQDLILIGVLKGAFVFLSDLVRKISIPVTVDFLRAASYGGSTSSSGRIQLLKDIELEIRGKPVLIVEDIVDTGFTLEFLIEHLKNHGAKDVRVCALIDKKERRKVPLTVDYACREIDEGFLVGYGLDHNEQYRGLPGIYHLNP